MVDEIVVPLHDSPMHIDRSLLSPIAQRLTMGDDVVVLYGPRQTGKTTLMRNVLATLPGKKLEINGDELRHIDVLSSRDAVRLGQLVEGYDILFIDEAQRIPEIGINLKILHDRHPGLRIAVTGSSSFDIARGIREPLTGRSWSRILYPISMLELSRDLTPTELGAGLEERLVLGSYPRLWSLESRKDKETHLAELAGSYLYRDILELASIRNPRKLRDILKLLAFQVGSEVSLSEIGRSVGMGKDTVQDYIDLLEKSFIIFELGGFGKNLRSEVTRNRKYYFFDNGIRNVIVDDLRPLPGRTDTGALWENWCIAERRKLLEYSAAPAACHFWRTYAGSEIDYLEYRDGQLSAWEFKYGTKVPRVPEPFSREYPDAAYRVVTPENWRDFVTKVEG